MTQVLVTGAQGFIGRHVMLALQAREGVTVTGVDRGTPADALDAAVCAADVVVHLAGVNRPEDPADFMTGNAGLTQRICAVAQRGGRAPLIVLSSSIQAAADNPYGRSKLAAEEAVAAWAAGGAGSAVVLRLSNVFGKWCRPNYNSAVATFCHAVATGAPYTVRDPAAIVPLVHVDDVVQAVLASLDERLPVGTVERREAGPVTPVSLGALTALIESFRASRETLRLPDFSTRFVQALYATYLSYLPGDGFAYDLKLFTDPRGTLAEVLKGDGFGQIFVSRTKPGITRGNHWHHTKVEKFLVVEGEAVIRFRKVDSAEVLSYAVRGDRFRVVDIPPGYTHSIENTGTTDMVCLFWASEIFDPARPDTRFEDVLRA
ncbi:MAG: NAD-dependent epimerase/dehydratase family protein [Gemmatimonadaceae bacterium]|nr:NAD-dependent epimerase/dehydratase family protein [Gemmatimonadaceae bacterium]